MRHMINVEEQSHIYYAAVPSLLINKYGYPPATLDFYRLQVKKDALVLKSGGKFKSLLKTPTEFGNISGTDLTGRNIQHVIRRPRYVLRLF